MFALRCPLNTTDHTGRTIGLIAVVAGLALLALAGSASAESSPIFEDGFNDGTVDTSKWPDTSGAQENANCGSASPPSALSFGGARPRHAATRSVDVSEGGEVSFQIKFGTGMNPCNGYPSPAFDDVTLQYSADGGTTWTGIATYQHAVYVEWIPVTEEIPDRAATSSTRFRWIQKGTPWGQHWAIDDVEIDDDVPGAAETVLCSYEDPDLGSDGTCSDDHYAPPTPSDVLDDIDTDRDGVPDAVEPALCEVQDPSLGSDGACSGEDYRLSGLSDVRDDVDADRDGVPDDVEPTICRWIENPFFDFEGDCNDDGSDYQPPSQDDLRNAPDELT